IDSGDDVRRDAGIANRPTEGGSSKLIRPCDRGGGVDLHGWTAEYENRRHMGSDVRPGPDDAAEMRRRCQTLRVRHLRPGPADLVVEQVSVVGVRHPGRQRPGCQAGELTEAEAVRELVE